MKELTRAVNQAGSDWTQAYAIAYAVAHLANPSSQSYFIALAAKEATIRSAEIQNAFTQGIITAQETRGLARSVAQQSYELALHVKQKERDNADIDSYKDYDQLTADHALLLPTLGVRFYDGRP